MSFIYCHLNFHANLLRPWPFPLSNNDYIEIDLFIVSFPYPIIPCLQTSMAIGMDLWYPLISESMDLQHAAELNTTKNVEASNVYIHWEIFS
jgi:hypothetical protein